MYFLLFVGVYMYIFPIPVTLITLTSCSGGGVETSLSDHHLRAAIYTGFHDINTVHRSKKNSQNGFVSAIWGPALWLSIHCISLNYPLDPSKADKEQYRTWFEGLELSVV